MRWFKFAGCLLAAALLAVPSATFARGAGGRTSSSRSSYSRSSGTGSHTISGYTRRNGTYVAPSHATNSNRTQRDNYSAKGNVNPFTGRVGTKAVTR